MVRRKFSVVLLAAALGLSASACVEYPLRPQNRAPRVLSVVAFPTTLRVGDSTLVTVTATDAEGDSLYFWWTAFNGLTAPGMRGYYYPTRTSSLVLYLASRPVTYDTAMVYVDVSDGLNWVNGGHVYFTIVD